MIYPDIDFKTWANRYGLTPKTKPCLRCKREFETTVPVAVKGYRGLKAPPHECGERYVQSIFVPVGKGEIQFWLNFKHGT